MSKLMLFYWFRLSALLPDNHQPHVYYQHENYPPEVQQQIMFYARHFNFDETVHIYFSLNQKLPSNLTGYITYRKDEEKNTHNIYIRIRKNLNNVQMRKVIAHEMIHANQYVTQELQILDDYRVLWKKKTIRDFRDVDYKEREWEHDAFSKTAYLVKLFIKYRLYDPPDTFEIHAKN